MKKLLLIVLMLLPIYGFATTDTTQTNVVYAPYPQYSFWSNWELGVRGGISTPFALENREGFNYMYGLSLYKELDNIWTVHFNATVNNLPNTVGYYGGLNTGLHLSLIDLFNGYDTTRFAKIYLNAAVGMGVDKSGYLVQNYGKVYYEAMAGIGLSWKIHRFTIRLEDNIVLPADLGNGFTLYKSYYNCVHLGVAYNFGITKTDRIRLEQMDMILNKGNEYDEVVDNYESTLQRKNDTLDQYEKSMARLIIVNQELIDTCIVLEKNTAAFDSLRAMIDKMKEEQHIYWAMPFSVDFDFDSYYIKDSQREKIKQVANVMADSNYHYMVVGFADSIGSVEYNMQLAEKRAKAVSEELIKYGVKAEQITVQSVGKNEPFGDPDSRVNRKVSFYREIE